MLNIVIPMAGRGSRFQKDGYHLPKPLLPIHGKKMIHLVINNLKPSRPHRFIFLCLQEHLDAYGLKDELEVMAPDCLVVPVNQVTEGAACTVLLAAEHIDGDQSLMIANSDQWVDFSIDDYLSRLDAEGVDGLIMTMESDHPKWSYVGFDEGGRVTRVVEKEVISNEATVGVYNFKTGADFVKGARTMIAKNLRVNGEFYVAPVYNELLSEGRELQVFNVGAEGAGMYGIGIPEDYEAFIRHPISLKATHF